MKNVTSIDLDSTFAPKQPEQPQPQKQEEAPVVKINWSDIMTEWCYRIPKGYPTVVDGVFTEYEEVKVLNEILEEKFGETIPLPEVALVAPQDVYKAISNTAQYKNTILPTQTAEPAIEKQNKKSLTWRVDLAGKDERVLKIQQLSKSLTSQAVKRLLGKSAEIVFGEKSFAVTVDGYNYIFSLKPAPKESKTGTDIKEGLSVILSYYPDYIPTVDSVSIKQQCKKIIAFANSERNAYDAFGIANEVRDLCVDYLKKITVATNKDALKDMVSNFNQNNSHANTFDSFFQKNKDFYIDRGDLFEEIRKVGSKLTGYPKDKWCPGDIYFIRNGAEADIKATLTAAEEVGTSNKEQAIGMLNSMFSDKYFNPTDKPIVAVSLKMEDAQAGKLKSGFEEYSTVPTEYGLDNKELGYSLADYQKGITKYQEMFGKELTKTDVDIDWKSDGVDGFCNVDEIKDLATLKFKYAAYKALSFIFTAVGKGNPKKFDDAIVSLVAFGLGVIKDSSKFSKGFQVNPPFFKAIASRSGKATTPVLFKPGSAMYIFNVDGSKKPKIKIEDNKGYKGLAVTLGLAVGTDRFDIRIRINSNGNKQVNVELEKARHLEA